MMDIFLWSFSYIKPYLEKLSCGMVGHYVKPTQELVEKFHIYFKNDEYAKIKSEYIEFVDSHGIFYYTI